MSVMARKEATSAERGRELRTRAEACSTSFRSGFLATSSAVRDALEATDATRETLEASCDAYDRSYKTVQDVLAKAKESLELKDKTVDVIVGIAIGVSIGLGVGAVVEAVGVTATAVKVAVEAAGEGAEALAAWGVGKTQEEKRDKSNADLTKWEGTTPTAKRLDAWGRLAEAYREAASTSLHLEQLADSTHWADLVAGDAKLHERGGAPERSLEEIERAVSALEKVSRAEAGWVAAVAKLSTATQRMRADQAKAVKPEDREVERQIWLDWVADLSESDRHRLLDEDVIEDHLREVGVLSSDGKNQGLLSADFGDWTSEDDTRHANLEAKAKRWERFADVFGPDQVGKRGTLLDTPTGDPAVDVPRQQDAGAGNVHLALLGPATVKLPGSRFDWPVDLVGGAGDSSPGRVEVGDGVVITAFIPAARRLQGRLEKDAAR